MAHNFRWYEKKRGHRRTGSHVVGALGEGVFFAVFLALGCGGLVAALLLLVVPEWRVNHEFVEHRCEVVNSRVESARNADGDEVYRPAVQIQYEINDVRREKETCDIHRNFTPSRDDAEAAAARFVKGRTYPCWYDPADPETVVLVRGYAWWQWLVLVVPASFLAIGGGGLIYAAFDWGRSAERRAALVRRVPRELFGDGRAAALPGVPDDADITSSPGTKLAFRLPIGSSPAWALGGLLLACVLWNVMVSAFAGLAIRSFLAGRPDWLLTLFVLPFLAVGIGLVVLFFRQFLVNAGIGQTLVEISEHPLLPGRQYRAFLSQAGQLNFSTLEMALVCEEAATYCQGTNARTETREVYRCRVLRREEFALARGAPLEAECEFAVPAGAMHSFKSGHNAIAWKLQVRGSAAGWPDFERWFTLIVHPAPRKADA